VTLDGGIAATALTSAAIAAINVKPLSRARAGALLLSAITVALVLRLDAKVHHHDFAALPIMTLAAVFTVRAVIAFLTRSDLEPAAVRWFRVTEDFKALSYLSVSYEVALLLTKA
jgi:hypothetical protein